MSSCRSSQKRSVERPRVPRAGCSKCKLGARCDCQQQRRSLDYEEAEQIVNTRNVQAYQTMGIIQGSGQTSPFDPASNYFQDFEDQSARRIMQLYRQIEHDSAKGINSETT